VEVGGWRWGVVHQGAQQRILLANSSEELAAGLLDDSPHPGHQLSQQLFFIFLINGAMRYSFFVLINQLFLANSSEELADWLFDDPPSILVINKVNSCLSFS